MSKYTARLRDLAAIDREPATDASSCSSLRWRSCKKRRRRCAATPKECIVDPRALEQIEDRLAEIQRLKRKYNAEVEDILGMQKKLRRRSTTWNGAKSRSSCLEKAFAEARQSAWDMAGKLSHERQRAAKKLKRDMEREVKSLGMPETVFEVRFATQDEKTDEPPFFIAGKKLTERGMDQVEFYFSPNPGEPVKPLAKIASGGELSRLMLALKSLVLAPGVVSTLLFDEVDAGVGGRVAEIVGKKLKQVAVAPSGHQRDSFAADRRPGGRSFRRAKGSGKRPHLHPRERAFRARTSRRIGAHARRRQNHRANPQARRRDGARQIGVPNKSAEDCEAVFLSLKGGGV